MENGPEVERQRELLIELTVLLEDIQYMPQVVKSGLAGDDFQALITLLKQIAAERMRGNAIHAEEGISYLRAQQILGEASRGIFCSGTGIHAEESRKAFRLGLRCIVKCSP